CYSKVVNVGNTSISVEVEVTAQRVDSQGCTSCINVTSALVTYVSVTRDGKKNPISEELKRIHGFLNA
ncbi:acyl-CoA thioesterase, partial [Campylobacter coli]|nr:acyl-CoA thioesterase [Campylobacter coli]